MPRMLTSASFLHHKWPQLEQCLVQQWQCRSALHIFEFTLNDPNGLDFFDTSLLDNYIISMLIVLLGANSGVGLNVVRRCWQVHGHWLPHEPQRSMPERSQGYGYIGVQHGRGCRMPLRLRDVRDFAILPQRHLWEHRHVSICWRTRSSLRMIAYMPVMILILWFPSPFYFLLYSHQFIWCTIFALPNQINFIYRNTYL